MNKQMCVIVTYEWGKSIRLKLKARETAFTYSNIVIEEPFYSIIPWKARYS